MAAPKNHEHFIVLPGKAIRLKDRDESEKDEAQGCVTVALMSATNFALYSDFRWLLLGPALVWPAGVVFYIAEH